ncbi:MAG: SCP2 sterol-binding domain-containing protein, partial [Candidatus Binatia bacterium]
MPRFPSAEWFAAFARAVNDSAEHKEAAAAWEGDVTLVVEAEPDHGVHEDTYAWLDLWHGACREARIVSVDEGERARFVISAPYSRWKDVIRGRLDPVRG